MAGEKQDGDTGTPAAQEESGAGYGNNALTDDAGQAGEDEPATDETRRLRAPADSRDSASAIRS